MAGEDRKRAGVTALMFWPSRPHVFVACLLLLSCFSLLCPGGSTSSTQHLHVCVCLASSENRKEGKRDRAVCVSLGCIVSPLGKTASIISLFAFPSWPSCPIILDIISPPATEKDKKTCVYACVSSEQKDKKGRKEDRKDISSSAAWLYVCCVYTHLCCDGWSVAHSQALCRALLFRHTCTHSGVWLPFHFHGVAGMQQAAAGEKAGAFLLCGRAWPCTSWASSLISLNCPHDIIISALSAERSKNSWLENYFSQICNIIGKKNFTTYKHVCVVA